MEIREGIAVFGEADDRTFNQLKRCIEHDPGARGVLCADNHLGYSQPIGGVAAYPEHISPSGVGFDIACGNKAVRTQIKAADLKPDLALVMDEIASKISFGVGRENQDDTLGREGQVIDLIKEGGTGFQKGLADLAEKQLGTVGSGNHYVDLLEDQEGYVWVGVHFGSRGFGHKTATHYMELSQQATGIEHKGMDAEPILLGQRTALGQEYLQAMDMAGAYAYAGRDHVVRRVMEILKTNAYRDPQFFGDVAPVHSVHNHHNFAWQEEHDGQRLWVVRKGATPAFPGQYGFVGGSMGDISVILRGKLDPDGKSEDALFSTVHGAGRVMSRTEAAGKVRKRWTCNNRDCDWVQPPKTHKPEVCPQCSNSKLSKRWVQTTEGKVDWRSARGELADEGIEIRGAGADEAPQVYKDLSDVLLAHQGTIEVAYTMRPLGVVMAGADIKDPYKD